MQSRVEILGPLLLGILSFAITTIIHALPLKVTVRFFRKEERLGRLGVGFWTDLAIVGRTISYATVAHLLEVAWWAVLYLLCGEFREFGVAFYHSAVNYTTLGYGDLVMSSRWKLLGPLEAANGMILFGVTSAIVFAVVQRLIAIRLPSLED